jgi:hypothetical protein
MSNVLRRATAHLRLAPRRKRSGTVPPLPTSSFDKQRNKFAFFFGNITYVIKQGVGGHVACEVGLRHTFSLTL